MFRFTRYLVDPKGWTFSCWFFTLCRFSLEKYVKTNGGKKWAFVFKGKLYRF